MQAFLSLLLLVAPALAEDAPAAAPPEPRLIDWQDVDVRVDARGKSEDYPVEAREQKLPDARCTVRVSIDPKGVPYDAVVSECPLVFHEAAREITLRYRFYPYRIDGVKSHVAFDLKVNFKAP
ncbi:MAG: energy transducer TonB [Myxococcota bacterium]